MTLSQLFANRPVPGWANYRLPIPSLYLCGSSAHPGGGVTGLPGRNAALEVLRDWPSQPVAKPEWTRRAAEASHRPAHANARLWRHLPHRPFDTRCCRDRPWPSSRLEGCVGSQAVFKTDCRNVEAAMPRATHFGVCVGGEWGDRPNKMDVRFPFDGSVVGSIAIASADDVTAATDAAVDALEHALASASSGSNPLGGCEAP